MRKLPTLFMAVSFLLLASPVFAQGTASTTNQADIISQLIEQIKVLQSQVAQLTTELAATKKEIVNIQIELRISKTLKFGMTDEEVKKLQEFLSTMPDVYPEGLVTGYFGSLTERAVKKWQENNGIESIGIVGPKTRAKLVEITSGGSSGGSSSPAQANSNAGGNGNGVGNTSSTTPLGGENRATTTPSGTTPAQPVGQTGVATVPATPAQAPSAPTTDTTSPTISNIQATHITETSSTVTWATNESSDSKVYFSPATSTPIGSDTQFVTSHSINLNSLSSSKTYYYVVVSKDGSGNTATSSEQSFATLTPPPPVTACAGITSISDTRDTNNPIYATVEIGNQCWLKRNLNVGTFGNSIGDHQLTPGSDVGYVHANNQSNDGVLEKWCYGNDAAKCDIYGGLYQWNEAMNYSTTEGVQGICPAGWHVPTLAEVNTILTYLGGPDGSGNNAGGKMKETGTGHWFPENTGADNSSGFTAYGAGYRSESGTFGNLGFAGHFWGSKLRTPTSDAYSAEISANAVRLTPSYLVITNSISVRCIKG